MKTKTLLFGMLTGAGLMYFFDPIRGRSRRARLQEQFGGAVRDAQDELDDRAEDWGNRSRGAAAEVAGRIPAEPVDDRTLETRVRSAIGHDISHPGAIVVEAENGRITLRGPVLADEVEGLIEVVQSVRGVRQVSNRLEVHQTQGSVPGLQGSGQPS